MYPRVLAAVVLSLLFGALPARATAPAGTLDPLLREALRARYPGKVASCGPSRSTAAVGCARPSSARDRTARSMRRSRTW